MYTSTILFGLLATVNAHMYMKTPLAFTFPDPSNKLSPLAADGSDFPCKMGSSGAYTPQGGATKMAIGEKQTLSFVGTAVHGGGSCQLALTKDKAPTPDTEWMVIHSIEGGCPARNQAGNLPEGGPDSQDTYDFTIPAGVEPGEYVFAWTWFNKVGNREMYMNCAPIEVTGGGSAKRHVPSRRASYKKRQSSSFPGLFKANIGEKGAQCSTGGAEPKAIAFPNAGEDVEKIENDLFSMQCDGGAGGSSSGGSSGGSSSGSGSASAPATPEPSGNSFKEDSGGVDLPEMPSSSSDSAPEPAAPATSSPAAAPAPETPAEVPEVPAAPATPSSAAPAPVSGGGGSLSGPCTAEGDYNCIGGTSFQRCASGAWTVAMTMASGTSCTPGQSSVLSMN